jgi:hypothetical protein
MPRPACRSGTRVNGAFTNRPLRGYPRVMAGLLTMAIMAAQLGAGAPLTAPSAPSPNLASASAQASVRILPGAKVSLSGGAEAQGYKLTSANITLEDGSQRPAELVEFQ